MKDAKFDLTNLTQKEVEELISYEKNPTKPLKYKEIYSQIVESMIYEPNNYKCEVVDKKRKIVYLLHVHTTPINTIFSIGLMVESTHRHLVRFDFNNAARHTNGINTDHEVVIVGSHVHFDSPAGKYEPKDVVPIGEINEFKNLKTIVEVWGEFVHYTNIKD